MGLFKSKEEKEREDSLDARFNKIDQFLGTLEEYNQFKGVEHVIMDTGCCEKYVSVYIEGFREIRHRLVEEGVVGLIHYVPHQRSIPYGVVDVGGYGVPVKRKE